MPRGLRHHDRKKASCPRCHGELVEVVGNQTVLVRGIEKVQAPRQRLEQLFMDIVEQARQEQVVTYGAQHGGTTAAFLKGEPADGEALIASLVREQPEPAAARVRPIEVERDGQRPVTPREDVLEKLVTTEQQLFQHAASLPDAKSKVASWLPPGPTAIADYPTVLLSGNWLSQEQVSAAIEFARFMRKPEQLA